MKNLITVLARCVPLVSQDVVPEQETNQGEGNRGADLEINPEVNNQRRNL